MLGHPVHVVYALLISSPLGKKSPLYSLGVINVVTSTHGNASEVGQAFCESPDVAALSFTGSTRVGKAAFISSNMHLRLKVAFHYSKSFVRQDSLPTMRGNGEEIGLGVGRQRSIHCFRLGWPWQGRRWHDGCQV